MAPEQDWRSGADGPLMESRQAGSVSARRWLALAVLCVAQFVDVLGVTVVVVALPHIRADLGLSLQDAQWVVSAYVLPFAGCLLLTGRAGDIYGRRLLFLAGLALFAAASLACGLAPSASVLLAARAFQGLGAAVVVPSALALLTTLFPAGPTRRRALAVWTAVAALGGAAGFALGGLLTDGFGWRAVFLLNVPIGLAAFALAPRLLRESHDPSSAGRIDIGGAVSLTGGLLLLVFGLTQAEGAGILSLPVLAPLVSGVALVGAFLLIERRVAYPLVPLRVVRVPWLVAAALVGATLTATTGPTAVLTSVYLQQVVGASPTMTGLVYVPFSLAVVAGAFVSTRLLGAIGPRATSLCGLLVVAAAQGLTASILGSGQIVALTAALALSGLGLGAASVAATAAGTSALGAHQQGLASGILNAAAQIGTAVGLAIFTAVAAGRTSAIAGSGTSSAALLDGFHWAVWAAGGVAVVATVGVAWYTRALGESDQGTGAGT